MPQVEELENLNIPKEKEVKEEIITADPQEPEEETSNEAIQNSDGSVEDDSGEAESIEMDSQNGDKSEDQPLIQNQPWSHTLSSPVGMEGCSPSLDFSRAESLHGIGTLSISFGISKKPLNIRLLTILFSTKGFALL
jgi:hypothetical protein